MYKFLFFLFFTISVSICRAQVVIGSSNVTPSAMLKLDSNTKALRIPGFSIINNTDALTPISSPANGLMVYNTSSDISNGIDKALAYWGSDGQYHFQGSTNIADNITDKDRIPILVFSANVGPKQPDTAGTTIFKTIPLAGAEILLDQHFAWNSDRYIFPKSGVYTVEILIDLSKSSTITNIGELRIINNGTTVATSFVKVIPSFNRGSIPVTLTRNFNANTNLIFNYRFSNLGAGTYRLESGTINIYRH
ncbi:hypothetical protein [Chryseobacterium indologenes]|nr:hypothetical protein [Chryseobacterium indologenes]